MKRLPFLLLLCAAPALGQSPSFGQGARVYIVPSDGFESRLSAAISRRNVPVVVVDGKSHADFKITTTSVNPSGKEAFFQVKVSEAGTDQVVWSYTGKSKKFSPDKAADEIARQFCAPQLKMECLTVKLDTAERTH